MAAEFPRDLGDTEFCRRLWAEMDARGYTSAQQLGDAIGITRGQPSKWLQGIGHPSGPNLGALADHFGCSMDYLWGRWPERTGHFTPEAVEEALTLVERSFQAGLRRARGQPR